MKKTKAVALAALVALLGIGTLTGCGERDDGITVVFWHTFGKTIQDTLDRKIADFEKLVKKQDGVTVHVEHNYRGGYDDILSNITQGFAAGNVPTMAVAYPDHVADYIKMQPSEGAYVVNLDQYIYDSEVGFGQEKWLGDDPKKTGTEDFIPAYFEEGQNFVLEGTYTLPLMKSTEVMFYNANVVKPLLEDMAKLGDDSQYYIPGLDSISDVSTFLSGISWDDLIKIGEYSLEWAKTSPYAPSKMEAPIFYDSDGNLFITKMMQREIPYSSVDRITGKGSIDFVEGQAREDAEAMVTELKEAYDKGILETKGTEGEYGSNYFVDGQAIFSIGSSGGTGYQLPSSDTFEVGVCMVPADNKNPLYVCQGPDLVMLRNPGLSDKENDERNLYAWKFMKYLTNPDVNVELCTYGSEGYSPVRQSAYETDEYMEYLEWGEDYAATAKVVINDIGTKYFTTAVFPGSATLRDQVGGIITEALVHGDTVSVTQAFTNAISTASMAM